MMLLHTTPVIDPTLVFQLATMVLFPAFCIIMTLFTLAFKRMPYTALWYAIAGTFVGSVVTFVSFGAQGGMGFGFALLALAISGSAVGGHKVSKFGPV